MKNHWHSGQVGPAWHYADSRARGIYLEGRGWIGGAAVLAFVHAPFHQLTGQERQTEESNSIPAPVPAAPPSAQRSWTDQPECGEHCYFSSFSSSYAVSDGATLKVSRVIFFFLLPHFFSVHTGCQLNDSLRTCRVVVLLVVHPVHLLLIKTNQLLCREIELS